ncbi:MAG: hypothetical protein LUF04_16045, partial [Bacteroides sp.]|nr:hypothetical protein [Bacteroides sp.]
MQPIDSITATYQQRSQEAGKQLNRIVAQIRQVSILRVCLFVAGVSAAIFLRHSSWWMITGALLVTFVPFLWLIKVHSRMFRHRAYLEKRQEVNDQELRALEHDYGSFENGKEFTDPTHLYTYDLDVFGEKSLFQYINRTVTEMGRKQLASWMIHHLRRKKEIVQRQEGIRELTPLLETRQEFRIQGLLHNGKAADEEELLTWSATPPRFRNRLLCRLIPHLVLALNVIAWGLMLAGIVPIGFPAGIFTVCVLVTFLFTRQISVVLHTYEQKLGILHTYASLLRIIESLDGTSEAVQTIRQQTN